jgi:hypothetical protein
MDLIEPSAVIDKLDRLMQERKPAEQAPSPTPPPRRA